MCGAEWAPCWTCHLQPPLQLCCSKLPHAGRCGTPPCLLPTMAAPALPHPPPTAPAATQEPCDLMLQYLPPDELGLTKDDLPRSVWPQPRQHLPPFHEGFTDYVRVVSLQTCPHLPGKACRPVTLPCPCIALLDVARGGVSARTRVALRSCWAASGSRCAGEWPHFGHSTVLRPLAGGPRRVCGAGLPHPGHRSERAALLPHGARPY